MRLVGILLLAKSLVQMTSDQTPEVFLSQCSWRPLRFANTELWTGLYIYICIYKQCRCEICEAAFQPNLPVSPVMGCGVLCALYGQFLGGEAQEMRATLRPG